MDQSEITGEREQAATAQDEEQLRVDDAPEAGLPVEEALSAGSDEAALSDSAAPDEEVPAADHAASEVEAARLEAVDEAARGRQLASVIEALLFASEEPVTVASLRKVIEDATTDELRSALEGLKEQYDQSERGFALFEMAGGYLICTRDTYAPWVEKMIKGKRRVRLSRAGLETIAVVAYKQPISRSEVERIRGVDCGGVLGTLVERDLVMIKGRDTGPGKPLLYGTTQEFLNYFGLNKISELPRLDELSTLAARNPAWSDSERARFQKHGVLEVQLELPCDLSASVEGEAAGVEAGGELTDGADMADTAAPAAGTGRDLDDDATRRRERVTYEAADGDADTDAGYGEGDEARPA